MQTLRDLIQVKRLNTMRARAHIAWHKQQCQQCAAAQHARDLPPGLASFFGAALSGLRMELERTESQAAGPDTSKPH